MEAVKVDVRVIVAVGGGRVNKGEMGENCFALVGKRYVEKRWEKNEFTKIVLWGCRTGISITIPTQSWKVRSSDAAAGQAVDSRPQ